MFRTQRHSSIGEIPRTSRQEKQKGHPKGCAVVQESASSCEVSTGDDEAVIRTQRHSSLGEIPRADRQEKQKGHPKGCTVVREFAPFDELPTGKDGAMFRTHAPSRHALGAVFNKVRVTTTQKKKKQDLCPAFCVMVTRTGIEPMLQP